MVEMPALLEIGHRSGFSEGLYNPEKARAQARIDKRSLECLDYRWNDRKPKVHQDILQGAWRRTTRVSRVSRTADSSANMVGLWQCPASADSHDVVTLGRP